MKKKKKSGGGRAKNVAAGIPALVSTAKAVLREAGVNRGLKALRHMNQKGGFDCPSCAWPDPDDDRSPVGEYCENGAKAVAEEATRKKLTASFFATHSVEQLAALGDYELGKKGRIAQPMYLARGASHYTPIAWHDAFNIIGAALNKLSTPDEAIFYTSGRTSNEAAFLYQLFVREYGTNNLPDCSNMCHESSGVALGESLGLGKGSVTLDDFYQAEVIIILGQNPGTNHPRMLSALQKAKANGAKIISINPLPEAGLMAFSHPQHIKGLLGMSTKLTDVFLQVKINGDMALLQAIECLLLAEEEKKPGSVFDRGFIEQNTLGYASFREHIQKQNVAALADIAGVNLEEVKAAADLLKDKKRIIACWAMGLTQHKNAVDSIKEIVNLLLLKGSIGKPGAGTCPVRGHSNVQGDRTMGIWERPSSAFLDRLNTNFGFTPPRHHGYDVVKSIKAMHDGKASVFIALGGNFLSATPDTDFTAEALQRCSLTVHVSTKLNRSHVVHGREALILPCLSRSDEDVINGERQFVSCENSMGVVQASEGMLPPVSTDMLSEPVIVCRMARATLGSRSKIKWEQYMSDYDAIRDDISRTIPGFENYNQRVRIPGGFYLPNANREGRFDTVGKKAHFNVATPSPAALKDGELMMMTIRSHDQFNTTIYGLSDRYRGIRHNRRVVMMNTHDMEKRKLSDGDHVDLHCSMDGKPRIAGNFTAISYPIPEGCTATYFPEANVLVPVGSVADKSGTPVSKSVVISIVKSALASSSTVERETPDPERIKYE
jgi:molybdopterin-dependent oxidoreductase alpha subunit